MSTEINIFTGAPQGAKARLVCAFRRWRQYEVAAKAMGWAREQGCNIHSSLQIVRYSERNWGIRRRYREAILAVLGLEDAS